MSRFVPAALTGGALLWVALLLLAPLALTSASLTFAFAASAVYEAAGFVCHQRAERSYELAATQMPVCARCVGLYVSGALGAAAAWLPPHRIPAAWSSRAARLTLAVAAVPTAVTWGLEWMGLWQPGNAGRAVAALPLGAAVGWMLVTTLLAEARHAFRGEAMRYHA
jgi:uncharacterized membrane protein